MRNNVHIFNQLLLTAVLLFSTIITAKAEFNTAFSFSHDEYTSLTETYTFNPVIENMPEEARSSLEPWNVSWKEKRWIFTPSYVFHPVKHTQMRAGVNTGIIECRFNAHTTGEDSSTSETWYMNHAFAFGINAEFILAADLHRGPFASISYDMLQASDEEDREVITSDLNTSTEGRNADFRWSTEYFEFAAGWNTGKITPMLGARLTRFHLEKCLTHNIDESTATDPIHQELIELLNSEPSAYRYRNQNSKQTSLFAALKWQINSKTSSEINASFDNNPQYMTSVTVIF